jgi:protein-S-isoprenylcysteine O-methyltransferase Ste14
LESKIPPPIVALLVAAAMKVVASVTPVLTLPGKERLGTAAILASAGLLIEVVAAATLVLAGTTVDPIHPRHSKALVVSGPYRFTRNPIYVGDFLILLGWAAYLGSPLALALTALFVFYIDRFQISPEERALSARFGETYGEYRGRVRRWL